jgi:hypothetical protein
MPAVHGLYCVTSVEALASDMVPRRPAAGGRWRARWHHGPARHAASDRPKCDQPGGVAPPGWSHFESTLVTRPVHAGHTIAQHPVHRVAPRGRTPGLAPVTAGSAVARRGRMVAGARGRDGARHYRRTRHGCRHPRWSHRSCEPGRAWNDGQQPPISTLVTQPPPRGPPWNAGPARRGGPAGAVLGCRRARRAPRWSHRGGARVGRADIATPSGCSTLVTPSGRQSPGAPAWPSSGLHAGHTGP